MKEFRSLLAVTPAMVPRRQVFLLVQNAMVLARWLSCEVHFLVHPSEMLVLEEVAADFRRTQPDAPPLLVIHQTAVSPGAGISELLRQYACDLILMQDSVLLQPTRGADERMLLEQSPVPVLIFPRGADFKRHPPTSFLAPLSGERRANEAAATALALARQTDSPIDFLHVTDPEHPRAAGQSMEGLGDQLHHEYTQMMEKIVSEASPYSTHEERKHVRHFYHRAGFTTEEIVKLLDKSPGSVLVVEWKGTLAAGRAETIKDILKKTHHSILFVKSSREKRSTLRVGKNIRAA